jgi:hypothetical protein
MQILLVDFLALIQLVGILVLIMALQKAQDGLEDSRGFHRVVEPIRHQDLKDR